MRRKKEYNLKGPRWGKVRRGKILLSPKPGKTEEKGAKDYVTGGGSYTVEETPRLLIKRGEEQKGGMREKERRVRPCCPTMKREKNGTAIQMKRE